MVSQLKIMRVKKEMSQVDLWMRTGVPQWRISLIERGVQPKPEEIRKIVKALDCQTKDLIPNYEK